MFQQNYKEFKDILYWYLHFFDKIVFAKVVVKEEDKKEELTEAFLIRINTKWQKLCEHTIYSSIIEDPTKFKKELNLSNSVFLDKKECEILIKKNNRGRFLSTSNYNSILSATKKYLVDANNPFLKISVENGNVLNELNDVRNYIVHESEIAKENYFKILDKYNTPHETFPGKFLILPNLAPGGGCFFAYYLFKILEIYESMFSKF